MNNIDKFWGDYYKLMGLYLSAYVWRERQERKRIKEMKIEGMHRIMPRFTAYEDDLLIDTVYELDDRANYTGVEFWYRVERKMARDDSCPRRSWRLLRRRFEQLSTLGYHRSTQGERVLSTFGDYHGEFIIPRVPQWKRFKDKSKRKKKKRKEEEEPQPSTFWLLRVGSPKTSPSRKSEKAFPASDENSTDTDDSDSTQGFSPGTELEMWSQSL